MDHLHHKVFETAEFLVENIGLLPGGRALDLAMGNVHNAIYLAGKGYDVESIDRSSEAIAVALERARQENVSIKAQVADLERDYIVRSDAFEVIVCFNYLQRSLIPQIKEGLRPGGMVVYETYIIDQGQFGHLRNPDFLLEHNELLEMFRDLRYLRYREGIIGSRAIASILSQKTS